MAVPTEPRTHVRIHCAACRQVFTVTHCAPGDDVACTECGETVCVGEQKEVRREFVRKRRTRSLPTGGASTGGTSATQPSARDVRRALGVLCTECGQVFALPDAAEGAPARCSHCAAEVYVGDPVFLSRRPGRRHRRQTPPFGLILVCGAFLLFVVLLFFTPLVEYIDWFDR